MPESTTEEPSTTTKPKTSAYLVCEGAECMCLLGSTPAKLKVTSHKKAYINDNKLVATEKDVTFEDKYFGTCSAKSPSSNACVPDAQKWLMSYKDIEVEDHKVLTDKSTLNCKAGGLITITKHGQTQQVSAEQAENMDRTIAVQVNALADISFVKIPDKTVRVNSITGTIVEEEKFDPVNKTEPIKSEKKNDPKDIFVRPGQAVEFTAAFEGTEALVCWRFNENGMNKYFLQHGSLYEARFSKIGKYTIEGYGTSGDTNFDVETQLNKYGQEITRGEDVSCSLDIIVKENKLINIRHGNSGNIVDIKLANKSNEVHVRLGVPAVFEAVFDMPPTKSEVEHLMLVLKDAGGNELKRTKGELKMVFEAKNSVADYSLEASFDNSDEKPIVCPIKTSLNTVSIVAATGAGDKEYDNVRPDTPIIFTVSKTMFTDDTVALELIESEESLIKWYENSEISVASGPTYSKVYQDEGEYTVRCRVTEGKPGWFNMKSDLQDDWHFVVTRNYPTAIEQKTAGLVKVGKLSTFEMKSIFNTNVFERKTIQWKLSGPQTDSDEGLTFYSFIPRVKGEYTVSATMNGETIEKKIECIECEIKDAWWTDADGNMLTGSDAESNPSNTIGFAGWGQEVSAAFNHVGLNGEKVRLEVWHKNDNIDHVLVKTLHITIPDTGNGVVCSFNTDKQMMEDIKWIYKKVYTDGNLYFKVFSESGLKIANNGVALPFNPEKYLQVDKRVRVRAYFADNNDTTRYCTADLNTPVFLQVKSTNLIDQELDVQFYRSIKNDGNNEELDYKSIGKKHTFKVETDGMKSIKIDLNAFKDLLQKSTDSVSIFATISTTSDSDEKYSTQNRYMLTLYKALLTNPVSKGTTKAFVTVGGSEGKANQTCECKTDNLVWGSKVSCAFRKKIIQISKELWPDKYLEMANGLMAVISVETWETFSPSKIELVEHINAKGKKIRLNEGLSKDEINKLDDNFVGAVGLIQFIQESIDAMNKTYSLTLTKKKLALMTDVEQLDYVKKYLMLYGWHKKITSPEDLYLHVFAPSGIGKDDNFVLYKRYEKPKNKAEVKSNENYENNQSIDEENNNDQSIQRFEILGRYKISFARGLSNKTENFTCFTIKSNDREYDSNGVLAEMKELVDKHIKYSNEGVREGFSEKSLLGLDCSETVSIYLYKLGVIENVISLSTGSMTTEKDFRHAIDSENIDFVEGSNLESFVPQRGDIFVWRRSKDGHTGIVYDYNKDNDLVTILEAIGSSGSKDEKNNVYFKGYEKVDCTRTAIYKRLGDALYGHGGWIGYFRPKNLKSKL